MTIHVVKSGETVAGIAESYGVDPVRLAGDNAVPESGALAVGQTLVIRFPQVVHAVRLGETLFSVASSYGVSIRQLWQNNFSLGGGVLIRPGDTLVISYFQDLLGAASFNGYAYPHVDDALLATQLPYLTYLTPFTYGISSQGTLLPLEDDALLAAARRRDVRPV
ncbi:MAG: LysM peptidoglycan-binding domain-containing protein, partial [Oscillospiraceae bacterium]|nr:LysM peptidoglycan-binding domain-containing protein [Oscillospiraceae bacterium]